MRQVAGLISTYSSDEFGACSALYELGGMVVMHDASGCNSTYTTHDEPRWYRQDSLIFISAISEMEAIMGDDQKLVDDIIQTARELKPSFVALVGAPIPYMMGTDLEAIARILESELEIPCFGILANGMQDYTKGISMALEQIVERFCTEKMQVQRNKVNILGATPLDFGMTGTVEALRKWLRTENFEPGVCMAMGESLTSIRRAGEAGVNLVISAGGVRAAEILKERYGTPYVIGIPFGRAWGQILAGRLKSAAGLERNVSEPEIDAAFYGEDMISVIGEGVFAASLARALELECGCRTRALSQLEGCEETGRTQDQYRMEEDDLIRELKTTQTVIADPMFRPVCGEDVGFVELPHIAFSGRIGEKRIPVLIGDDLEKWIRGQEL